MSKLILMTGAAGFIGAHTCQLLLEQNCTVVGIDNMNDYYDINLKYHRLNALKKFPNFTFLNGDIENKNFVFTLFEKYPFTHVLNLAARAGVRYSIENPDIYFTTNVFGLLNILEAMKKFKVKKLLQASTSSLYAGLPLPFNEDSMVDTPISPYAASKKAAEVLAYAYHHLYQMDVSIVRYFTVYGPAGRPDMSILKFIKRIDSHEAIDIYGDGNQTRDFTFVLDIAKGTIAASFELQGHHIINLGGGKTPTPLKTVITTIEKLLNKKAIINYLPFHQADMIETQADTNKAFKLLQWKAKIDIEEGIEQTIKWYLDNYSFCKSLKI